MNKYTADIVIFEDNGGDSVLAVKSTKSSGTITQVLKDVKALVQKYESGLKRGNVCVTIKDATK